jgi:maltooligosyltrehalose trehalohydrolase
VLRGGFFHDGTYSSFREREHGHPIDTVGTPSWRLVTFTQDHDQIGNRAAGDRPSQYLDDASLRLEAVLAVLTPFTPMLFMGQEWGASTPWQFFTSHPEPELGHAVSKGRLAEFSKMGWDEAVVPDPQDPQTFERSKLDWSEVDAPAHARLLALHRELAALRHATPEFSDPSFPTEVVHDDSGWLWFGRGSLAVVLNFASVECEVELAASELVLATADGVSLREASVVLPARSAAVVRRAAV